MKNYVSVNENDDVPEMHGMDDYTKCKTEKGLYCKFKFKIYPASLHNPVWQKIEVSWWINWGNHSDIFDLDILC